MVQGVSNSQYIGIEMKSQTKSAENCQTMILTCKNVAPYSPTSLTVGTMVNTRLCDSLVSVVFVPSLHPYYFL